MSYWISYQTRDASGASDAIEQNDTALGAYTRATDLTAAGEHKVKIRDGDTFSHGTLRRLPRPTTWQLKRYSFKHQSFKL